MKLFWIGTGIIFLANPVMGVYDWLPDFIGCFLIMYAVRDAAYMIEKLQSARRWFMYAAWLGMARSLISLWDVESQHTLPLTLAFIFAVLEVVVYIPAFKDLFNGFDYAAMRHGGSGILSMGQKEGFYTDESGVRQYGVIQDDTTGKLARFSQIFIVIRAALSVLPELPSLQLADSENVGDVTGFQFASIGNLIKLSVFVLVLIPAIVLIVRHLKFLHRIKKTGDFIPAVERELHSRFGDLSELHTASRMRLLVFFLGAAVILFMGFYDYQINVIPRYICAAAVILASVLMFFYSGRKGINLLPVIPALGAVPLSLKTYALQSEHYRVYKLQMISLYESGNEYIYDRNINAIDDEYLVMARWEMLEALVLGIAIVLLLIFYMRVCLSHAKSFSSVAKRYKDEIALSLKIRGGFMIGTAVLSTAYFTVYRYILPYFDSAYIAGIGVNVLALVLFITFAVQANQHVYDNIQ